MPNFRFVDGTNVPFVPKEHLRLQDITIRDEITNLNGWDDPAINTTTKLGNSFLLKVPCVVTMATKDDCISAHGHGAVGILSNNKIPFPSIESFLEAVVDLNNRGIKFGFTIGTNPEDEIIVSKVLELGVKNPLVFVQGNIINHRKIIEQVRRLSLKYRSDIDIMAGYATCISMLVDLVQAGANAIHLGEAKSFTLIQSFRHAVYSMKRNVSLVAFHNCEAHKEIAAGLDVLDVTPLAITNTQRSLRSGMLAANCKNLMELSNDTVFTITR